MFSSLHTLFETEYSELALAVDEVAERITKRNAFADRTTLMLYDETGDPDAVRQIVREASD